MNPSEDKPLPLCRSCGRPLPKYQFFGHPVIDPERSRQYGYEGNGYFCTLRCGFKWALAKQTRGRKK
jgi:hypothetical protein